MKNVRIVLADDEEIITDLLKDIMDMSLNRKAISFNNGLSAWQYIKDNNVDIVISDIDMPGMNGLELLRKVKTEFPEIIFICMSGRALDHIEEASKLEANHFLAKPFLKDIKEFVRIIRKYITEEEK